MLMLLTLLMLSHRTPPNNSKRSFKLLPRAILPHPPSLAEISATSPRPTTAVDHRNCSRPAVRAHAFKCQSYIKTSTLVMRQALLLRRLPARGATISISAQCVCVGWVLSHREFVFREFCFRRRLHVVTHSSSVCQASLSVRC